MSKEFGGASREFRRGDLNSGGSSGPVVRNPKQANAMGKKVPSKPKGPLDKAMGKVGKAY